MRGTVLFLALCPSYGWLANPRHGMKHLTSWSRQRKHITTIFSTQKRSSSSTAQKAKSSKGSTIPKNRTHPRNAFQGSYDMDKLCQAYSGLSEYIVQSPYSTSSTKQTIHFDNPHAVRSLNAALLAADYNITSWEKNLPMNCLTPPIPGRADYVHYAADVLGGSMSSGAEGVPVFPTGPSVQCLDIGTGGSLIYPLIATSIYGWSCIATDVSKESLQSARQIAKANSLEQRVVDIRQQKKRSRILTGILQPDEIIDVVICNPPFYESREAFDRESSRKVKNLNQRKQDKRETTTIDAPRTTATVSGSSNNFGGTASELWYPGGEVGFISTMMDESRQISNQCLWFSCLVSRRDHVPRLKARLQEAKNGAVVRDTRIITMGQGRKSSVILFWSFHNRDQQKAWCRRQKW